MRIATAILLLAISTCEGKLQNLTLDYQAAEDLASLPLKCYNQEFPYMDLIMVKGKEGLKFSKENHPIFYGCFDWHSSVHGHWLLSTLARRFPGTDLAFKISDVFDEQFTKDKVKAEMEFLKKNPNYERTYGWAWFLKLQNELVEMANVDDYSKTSGNFKFKAKVWVDNLKPMADFFVQGYLNYLPQLVYPLRGGTHYNLAFGLTFAFEYAEAVEEKKLADLIKNSALKYYKNDHGCPLTWEPSGKDFLSPCLQEADLMMRIQPFGIETILWLEGFLPGLQEKNFVLKPGQVLDETDGHLVHLHGVNFSRAWNIYSLIKKIAETAKEVGDDQSLKRYNQILQRLLAIGDDHMNASLDKVINSHYMGSHWLASFLTYALIVRDQALKMLSEIQ